MSTVSASVVGGAAATPMGPPPASASPPPPPAAARTAAEASFAEPATSSVLEPPAAPAPGAVLPGTAPVPGPVTFPAEAAFCCEILPNRLYYVGLAAPPAPDAYPGAHFFTIDSMLTYVPFYKDFGPLHLGCTYRFTQLLKAKLASPKLKDKVIFYYSSPRPQPMANAACLIGIFQVSQLGRSAADAYAPLLPLEPFVPFNDASMHGTTYRLMPAHVIHAFAQAQRLGWVDLSTFNIDEYEHFECVENGDLNVVLPGKFIAFSSPYSRHVTPDGYTAFTPQDYVPIFRRLQVTSVVRLNDKTVYDRRRFLAANIRHVDLFFEDGSNPPERIRQRFLAAAEANNDGLMAVHCKAGLGRTGSLIGAYMMKHHGISASDVIGWLRLCRPGSVIGQQQHYLASIEAKMHAEGRRFAAGGGPAHDTAVSSSAAAAVAAAVPALVLTSRRSLGTAGGAGAGAGAVGRAVPRTLVSSRTPATGTGAGAGRAAGAAAAGGAGYASALSARGPAGAGAGAAALRAAGAASLLSGGGGGASVRRTGFASARGVSTGTGNGAAGAGKPAVGGIRRTGTGTSTGVGAGAGAAGSVVRPYVPAGQRAPLGAGVRTGTSAGAGGVAGAGAGTGAGYAAGTRYRAAGSAAAGAGAGAGYAGRVAVLQPSWQGSLVVSARR